MTKEEIYKASDVLNTILDNYLHGGEAAEVVTKFEDELIKLNLTKEEPISDDFTKVLAECFLQSQCNGVDPMAHAEIWKDALIKLAKSEEPVSTKDKLLALSDGRLHLGWIDDAKVVEFEECLMQFHEDMNNIPQGTDSLTRLKDTDGVLHSYSKKLMSMPKEEPVSEQNLSNVQRFGKNWKEPVSEDLEEASKEWLRPQLDKSYANYGEVKMMELTHFDGYAMLDAIEFGAKWQKEKFMAKAVDGHVTFEFYGLDSKTYGTIAHDPICFEDFDINDSDKVKLLVLKEV